MPRKKRERWRAVTEAREYIASEARAIAKSLVKAAKNGDAATGRWLLEHTAIADDTGTEVRPIASSSDRQVIASPGDGGNAPRIMIGVSLGNDFAQLASQAPAKRLNAPIRVEPAVIATADPQRVSPGEASRGFANVLDAVPVLASQADTEPSV